MHITFSTKHRVTILQSPVREELHRFLGGCCNKLECQVITIGGFSDHVHVLCFLSKKIPLVKLIEEIKSQSSRWIKTKGSMYKSFCWQNGYGAFSINPKDVNSIIDYINNQQEHHKKKSFEEEYRDFLKEYHIVYDERYVWD